MKTLNKIFHLIVVLTTIILISCDEEPIPPVDPDPDPEIEEREEASALTQKVNEFIEIGMNNYYLWYNEMPTIDIKYELDSKEYFDKLLYVEDKWSYITDDRQALENSFEGTEKTYGWSLAFGRFSNTNSYFAMVEFVYPNTPASRAGLKRGDLIVEISGRDINEGNYRELLNGDNLTITLGEISDGGIGIGSTVDITSEVLNLNPVIHTNIIEESGRKIGYLFYAQYIANFNTNLDTAFQYFKDQQITDLVLDLRYNPGGGTIAAQHLCSSLAPASVVNEEKILVTFQYNDKYQAYLESENMFEELQILFNKDVPNNMDLNNLHIITGRGSASASELTITGLKPYMNITTVGETTYGKYTASFTLKPEYFYSSSAYYSEFDNWGIQPIVLRYANSEGVTDFKDGFVPDIPVEDDLIYDVLPLGQKEEPLLKAAIEDITGIPIVALKKTTKKMDYTIFDRGFSKYDLNKRELVIENFDGSTYVK